MYCFWTVPENWILKLLFPTWKKSLLVLGSIFINQDRQNSSAICSYLIMHLMMIALKNHTIVQCIIYWLQAVLSALRAIILNDNFMLHVCVILRTACILLLFLFTETGNYYVSLLWLKQFPFFMMCCGQFKLLDFLFIDWCSCSYLPSPTRRILTFFGVAIFSTLQCT